MNKLYNNELNSLKYKTSTFTILNLFFSNVFLYHVDRKIK